MEVGDVAVLTTFPIFYAICMGNHRIIIGNVAAGTRVRPYLRGGWDVAVAQPEKDHRRDGDEEEEEGLCVADERARHRRE